MTIEVGNFLFAKGRALVKEDLNEEKTEFLIPRLLVKNSITMWYSKPSQGKTWFTYAVAKKILQSYAGLNRLFYIDYDNGKRQLKERNVDKELLEDVRFSYMHKGKVGSTAEELIEDIGKEAIGQSYKGCVFIFDSTRDFVYDIHNNGHAKRFMEVMKDIREAGGTVILIHHTSKSGRVIDGSGEFTKSTDNAFELEQTGKTHGKLHYLIKVTNDRDSVSECAFTVNLKTLDLMELDPVLASMTAEDKEFVKKATDALKAQAEGLNKTKLIEATGTKKHNKKAREAVERYTDVFWIVDASKKDHTYTTI